MNIKQLSQSVPRIGDALRAMRASLTTVPAGVTSISKPVMRPLSAAEANASTDILRGMFSWVDDGNCFERASMGAAMINQTLRGGGAAPALDAQRAAVAIMKTNPQTTGWRFHAATAWQDRATGTMMVFDQLTDPRGPTTVRAWATAHGVKPSDVQLRNAVADYGIPQLSAPVTDLPLRSLTTVQQGAVSLRRSLLQAST